MLRIVWRAAESAPHAQPAVFLKSAGRGVDRVTDDLDGNRPLPIDAVVVRVNVDAGQRIDEIRQVGDERDGGDGEQRAFDRRDAAGDDVRAFLVNKAQLVL